MKKLLILIPVIILCSCQRIVRLSYGIHDPKPQTTKKLDKYLDRKGIGHSRAIYFKDREAYNDLVMKDGNIPNLLIFDKEGRFIKYKADTSCNAAAFDFLANFCSTKFEKPLSNSDSLSNYLDHFVVNTPPDHSKYTVIIKWTEFSGRLNKDHVLIWLQTLVKIECTPNIYLANFDELKSWNPN